jgi:hypothetical protein
LEITEMGMDVFVETFVLISVDEMLPLFNSRKLAKAISKYWPLKYEELIEMFTVDGRIRAFEGADDRGSARDRLSAIKSGKGLHAFLIDISYSRQSGAFESELPELWNQYLKAWQHFSGIELPAGIWCKSFDNSRLTDWRGDLDKPYLAFSVEETLVYSPTEKGKNLQAALNRELAPVSWASMSY